MHIELAELLRCPESHPQTHCVLLPTRIVERDVTEGIVGCPACHREYPITDGIVRFGPPPILEEPPVLPAAEAVHALLGLTTPGGTAVLVGSAARLAAELARLMNDIHLLGANASRELKGEPALSLVESTASLPLRDAMARGVVLGAEYADGPWTEEAGRILLPGLRLVVLRETAEVEGVERVSMGKGMWVGTKTRR